MSLVNLSWACRQAKNYSSSLLAAFPETRTMGLMKFDLLGINAYINVLLFVELTCEANRRNTKNDNSVSVIFFLNSLHHNWLQYIEEDVNLNVICTKYRHGYHKLYYRIISKKMECTLIIVQFYIFYGSITTNKISVNF